MYDRLWLTLRRVSLTFVLDINGLRIADFMLAIVTSAHSQPMGVFHRNDRSSPSWSCELVP